MATPSLTTTYLGLELPSPIVASAGPFTGRLDTLSAIADAGAGAVVLPSLFEEEIVRDAFQFHALHVANTDASAEARGFLPPQLTSTGPAERYLELIELAKRRLDIPVIASLNGLSTGSWVRYATEAQQAGADAVELNVYVVAADPHDTALSVEHRLADLVRAVRRAVSVPLAVKLSPFFSALGDVAEQVAGAGADGLVLFNRFSQPDFDLEDMAIVPGLELSTPADVRLPLRWIGLLHGRLPCSLALSGGVHTPTEAVKAIAAGADVAMMTSALLRHGPDHLRTVRDGLQQWLERHDYVSADELRGSMSQRAVPNPDGYERFNYLNSVRRTSARYGAAL